MAAGSHLRGVNGHATPVDSFVCDGCRCRGGRRRRHLQFSRSLSGVVIRARSNPQRSLHDFQSMTSSAVANSFSGIVRPSALAVFRLMTNSNSVASCRSLAVAARRSTRPRSSRAGPHEAERDRSEQCPLRATRRQLDADARDMLDHARANRDQALSDRRELSAGERARPRDRGAHAVHQPERGSMASAYHGVAAGADGRSGTESDRRAP
jgi:hypothetical protein